MSKVPIVREKQITKWPEYDRLEGGLPNYWYPVMQGRKLRGKVPMRILGESVLFVRDGGEVFAIADRCMHRGTPMRFAKRDFPGTLSCIYHGWCYDLRTGNLVAALTDGPDSPMVGKVAIKTYPVEERFGLIWIFIGEGTPPPLEEDVPEDFLDPRTVRCVRISEQEGNWRFAVENTFDDAHAYYLHRSSLYGFFSKTPAYKKGLRIERNGKWLVREQDSVHFAADYRGLGRWPKIPFWQHSYPIEVRVRMPGIGMVKRKAYTNYKFHVPLTTERFLFVQVIIKRASRVRAWLFRMEYWLIHRWLYHVMFNNDDVRMTKYSHSGPEHLFRPDVSLTTWRKMCLDEARTDHAAAE